MNKIFYLLVFKILILSSCRPTRILESDLNIKEFKYYTKATNRLFTGTVITNFDNGNLSSTIEIKDGIPDGKWAAYGYKGEIIQEGTYKPIDISDDNFLMQKKIKRLNICYGEEGSYRSTDIYVVTDTIGLVIDAVTIKKYIKNLCVKKNILPLNDSSDEIKIVGCELN